MQEANPAARKFVDSLTAMPAFANVFNPWRDYDPENDIGPQAPGLRADNLARYLEARVGKARILLAGEAPGYAGCKASGIAMTSERIMLGHHKTVPPDVVFPGAKQQTSRPELHKLGSNEQTASVVWAEMLGLGFAPEEFVFWNAFPCHPHLPDQALTNRAPTPKEVTACAHFLKDMVEMLGEPKVVAIGRVAQRQLKVQGIDAPYVRHPAMAGITQFRAQVRELAQTLR